MLEAAAEQALLIGQLRSILAWVGPGRKLPSIGRIGLADARHLVELLGTCYEDDFGDGWEYDLAEEASAVADAATSYPARTGGQSACPPEDCGGPGGLADLKDLLAGP